MGMNATSSSLLRANLGRGAPKTAGRYIDELTGSVTEFSRVKPGIPGGYMTGWQG